MNRGEIHVWRVRLDGAETPPPTPGEAARAARFRTADLQRRYLRSHGALRAILGRYTGARLDFAVNPHGKPYLPAAPEVQFNLSHSGEMALVGVALGVEIGVDVERIRPMPDWREIADRFFPPSEAALVADGRDFFHRWTRIEAAVKALGVGIYGLGAEIDGEWTIEPVDAGPEYAAAAAAPAAGMRILVHDFERE
ncbi:MAG TPA: 4'-phosphopantetheinyl transferase superfamily protein [Bryobacteraceae bacterium]|jgi:4'-phosphopantetheinyl transferase|nr:4'-phosphopantetheinyl transferase superfamily protein [Bryobacteraceae bacterium]